MADATRILTPKYNDGGLSAVAAPSTAPGPYVLQDDKLILSLTTSNATGSVTFSGRLLRLDGEIVPWNETLTFSGTGTQTDKVVPLAAGFLIGFDVSRASGTLTDGQVNCSVHLGRNSGSLQQKLVCLASGDITDIRSLGLWGYTGGSTSGTTSQPTIVTAAIANPAPGAELSVTVTASQVWELLGLRAILTNSATVASREVQLRFDDGTNEYLAICATTTQTASQAKGYTFADLGTAWTSAGAGNFMVPLPRLMLGAGYRMYTTTANIQAGDQWSACFFSYRRYT